MCAPNRTLPPSIRASTRFIAGEPMNSATKRLTGVLVEALRRVELLQLALPHHGDAVAERHRLRLVVRDVDRGHAQGTLDAGDLGPHLHAELRVEVGERLVHQERRGSRTIARPIATRWRWPPDSVRGFLVSTSSSPSTFAALRTRRSISGLSIPRILSANAMLA